MTLGCDFSASACEAVAMVGALTLTLGLLSAFGLICLVAARGMPLRSRPWRGAVSAFFHGR